MTAPASQAQIPTVAGKYRPLLELGRGGMATVVLAVAQGPGGFNKLQVLKRLRKELAADPDFLTMFLDEARLAARISHTNVVQTNEIGFDGSYYFIAMEFLDGQPLDKLLVAAERAGGMPLDIFCRILVDGLHGLHYAHELTDFDGTPLNVVHRDISPHNMFVTYEGVTKLVDFGIAKAADSSGETRTGVIKGKVAYMAPEQFGAGKVDRRADIFAFGVVLWRGLTGTRLWKGMGDVEVFQALVIGEIPSPLDHNPEAPQPLVDVCMKAMAAKPDDRYQTAADMAHALDLAMKELGLSATSRDVGTFELGLFAERRAEVKSIIDERIKAAPPPEAAASTQELPALPESAVQLPPTGDAAAVVLPAPRRSSTTLVVGILGAVLAGGTAAAVSYALGPPEVATPPPKPTPSASAPKPTPKKDEFSKTNLTVHVDPKEARVFVDETRITGDPPRARVNADGAKHWVHAELDGYETAAELVRFGPEDLRIGLSLTKKNDKGGSKKPNR